MPGLFCTYLSSFDHRFTHQLSVAHSLLPAKLVQFCKSPLQGYHCARCRVPKSFSRADPCALVCATDVLCRPVMAVGNASVHSCRVPLVARPTSRKMKPMAPPLTLPLMWL
jgi:hypothetical protein